MIRERENASPARPACPARAASRSSPPASIEVIAGAREPSASIDHRVEPCAHWIDPAAHGPLRGQPERRQGAAVLRRLRRHRQAPRTALGEPALHEEADFAARPKLRELASQGQRQRGQSDRDRCGRRVAGRRHGGSGLRGGRLQELRQGADARRRCATSRRATRTTRTTT